MMVFVFVCTCCGKEIVSDGVVGRCCNQLMQQKKAHHLSEAEMMSLRSGVLTWDKILEGTQE